MRTFEHEVVHRVRMDPESDDRAPGAAVTVELCGHWEHAGECRWPHHTGVERDVRDDALVVRTTFDAPSADVDEVRARIRRGLSVGRLVGPDGTISRWTVLDA